MRFCAATFSASFFQSTFSSIFLAALIAASMAMSAQAEPTEPCEGDIVEITGKLQPGAQPGQFVDTAGREYFLDDIYFINARNAEFDQIIAGFVAQSGPELVLIGNGQDRYDRTRVHIYSIVGNSRRWLQQALIEAGKAIVRPGGRNSNCLAILFKSEQLARKTRVGDRQENGVNVMSADDPGWPAKKDAYRIVAGRIVSVGETGSRIYLNFGNNWQTDFTVTVAKRNAKRFKSTIADWKELAGRKVRVRGWMVADRGPKIEVYYPGQLELDVD